MRPPWLRDAHIKLSNPRPKTRKLQGDFLAMTLREREISWLVCCGMMREVTYFIKACATEGGILVHAYALALLFVIVCFGC